MLKDPKSIFSTGYPNGDKSKSVIAQTVIASSRRFARGRPNA